MSRTRWMIGGLMIAAAAGGVGVVSAATTGSTAAFNPMVSCRLADTRPAPDTIGDRATPLGEEEEVVFSVHGANGDCTIPSAATAVTINVIAIGPTADSYLAIWPSDEPNPGTSSLNYLAGAAPTPNTVTVALSPAGEMTFFNRFGSVDVVIDISGYFADHDHDDRYYTKGAVDGALGDKADAADVYTKSEVYTKGAVDGALGDKADAADVYTKSEVYTKAEVDGLVGGGGAGAETYVRSDAFECDTGGAGSCLGGTYTAPLATCDPGDVVTGGAGARTSATSAFSPQDLVSFPVGTTTPTGWTTTNEINYSEGNIITVYVICADIA